MTVINNDKPSIKNLLNITATNMKKVDEIIVENMQSDVPLIPLIANHLISAGGKRIRPMLTIASYDLCKANAGNRALPPLLSIYSSCVEFIHTATLLHDDVVDISSVRRGSETANTVWGNSAAVLVGDFLFSRAFQLMANADCNKATKYLSNASVSLAEGEILQLLAVNNLKTTKEEYLKMIKAKTSVLFAAASAIGGVIANASDNQVNQLYNFGEYLGIAFQIADDSMDYSGQALKMGKEIGGDFREGKLTLPIILVFENASVEEKTFLVKTIEKQEQKDGDFEHIQELIEKYDSLNKCYEVANQYVELAKKCLDDFEDSDVKNALLEAVDYSVYREV